MEHRCGKRYPVDVGVYARSLRGALSSVGNLCEISISGGFVRTALPIQMLAYISVELLIDGRPAIEGQVVRRTCSGIGIEWNEYAPWLVQLLTERTPALPLRRSGPSPPSEWLGDAEPEWQEAPNSTPRQR